MDLKTTHNLKFEVAESIFGLLYKIGTCHGQWFSIKDSYCILSIINDSPGNGHLNDVFEWFEFSCKRDKKNLLVLECFNTSFYEHLLSKRGFIALDADKYNCIKVFNKSAYKRLIRCGNEVLIARTFKAK